MIRHIVIINFKKGLHKDYPALLEQTRPFLDHIPGIVSYKIFPNTSKYVPENVYGIAVEIVFEDKLALDGFMVHPKHVEANAIFEEYLADPPFMVLTHEV